MENRPQSAKPEEVAKVYREVAKRAAKVLNDFAKKRPQLSGVSDELGIAKALWLLKTLNVAKSLEFWDSRS